MHYSLSTLSAVLLCSILGLGAPISHSIITSATLVAPIHPELQQLAILHEKKAEGGDDKKYQGQDVRYEDEAGLAKFDNSEYHPSQTESPTAALRQSRPLPTLYLMSLEDHSSHPKPEAGRAVHASVPESWFLRHASYPIAHEKPDGKPEKTAVILCYKNLDLLAITFFGSIFLLILYFETSYRMTASYDDVQYRAELFIGRHSVRTMMLDGEEKQLRASDCENAVPGVPSVPDKERPIFEKGKL